MYKTKQPDLTKNNNNKLLNSSSNNNNNKDLGLTKEVDKNKDHKIIWTKMDRILNNR